MTLKEKINLAFTFYKNSKKKIIYSIIMSICCIAIIIILVFFNNVIRCVNEAFSHIGFRSVAVYNREGDGTLTPELKEKILNLNHVVDVDDESGIASGTIEFANGYQGQVGLQSRVPKTIPKIIHGRNFEEDETGVIICPISFASTEEYLKINKKDVINLKKLINTEIEFTYYDYKRPEKLSSQLEYDQKYIEKFKLIGVFSDANQMIESYTCFINRSDLKRIKSVRDLKYNDYWNSYYEEHGITTNSNFIVIADNRENMPEVQKELENIGLEVDELQAELDNEMIKKFLIIIIIFFSVSLFTTIIVSSSYAKKKLIKEEKDIKVMISEGFLKKDISTIYALETLIQNSIIYLIIILLFSIAFYYFINSNETLLALKLMMGLEIGLLSLFITYLLIVILPSYLVYHRIKRKY